MGWCPHCEMPYDEDNETQPCCGACGHPLTCGCNLGVFSAAYSGLQPRKLTRRRRTQTERSYDYYAIVKGRIPGIYNQWYGPNHAQEQVNGFSGQLYMGFYDLEDAINWYREVSGGEEPILKFQQDW